MLVGRIGDFQSPSCVQRRRRVSGRAVIGVESPDAVALVSDLAQLARN